MATALELSIAEADFLNDNLDATGRWSDDAKELVKAIVKSAKDDILISAFPFIKYPKNLATSYRRDYPKLTEYLKNQLPKVGGIPKIIDAIHHFTQLPKEQIINDLKWGNGPEIEIVQLDNYNSETDAKTAGYFDKSSPNKIYIDIDYVQLVEHENKDSDALIFWIGTTVLHEYVHFGNYQTGFQYPGEDGRMFEIAVYGLNVQPDTARMVLDRIE